MSGDSAVKEAGSAVTAGVSGGASVCGAIVTATELPEVSGAELESVETVWEGMTNSGTLLSLTGG